MHKLFKIISTTPPKSSFLIVFVLLMAVKAVPQYHKYSPLTLDFEVKPTTETDEDNPFLNYRLQIDFYQDGLHYSVPGFYAADGDAANSGASSGNVWRAYFTPPTSGKWTYKVNFKSGQNIAVISDYNAGVPVPPFHGKTGTLQVQEISPKAQGFALTGGLQYQKSRYLHTQNGEPILLFGANSPENFLAYQDIDGTYAYDSTKSFIKSWSPHIKDWKAGDPVWKGERGKGIIGALNYLSAKGMNVAFALVNNIEGDARDVWPFLSHEKKDYTRYDVSKLAQWDIIFSHAENLGIVMHLCFQEQENQLLLDDGDTILERRLFLRELIARFGHHNNIIWNIGEENGGQYAYWPQGQSDQQRFAMIRYLKDQDPYKNPIVMGTYAVHEEREDILRRLLRFDRFDGISMQSGNIHKIHGDIKHWIEQSEKYDRPWIVLQDEIGPWHTGTRSDMEDPDHDTVRKEVLWSALTAGATGVAWYFGWNTPPHDLNAEDWRSRNNIWEQSAIAKTFFDSLDYTAMKSTDELITIGNNYCFSEIGEVYVIYLKDGGETALDLRGQSGSFATYWYNPRTGGEMIKGQPLKGGDWRETGKAPQDPTLDWVLLVKRE